MWAKLTKRQEIAPGQEPTTDADANKVDEAPAENDESKKDEETPGGQAISQTPGFGAGFGFDPSAAGAFPGMGFGGDFNQMQMMMAMQNGMGPGGFNNFPMMGKFYAVNRRLFTNSSQECQVCHRWAWIQCRCSL